MNDRPKTFAEWRRYMHESMLGRPYGPLRRRLLEVTAVCFVASPIAKAVWPGSWVSTALIAISAASAIVYCSLDYFNSANSRS